MTLAVYVDGRWQPGIGDPTVMGWLTVAAYLLAAGLCAARALRVTEPIRPGEPVQRWFWWLLAAGLAFLAVNKQLDLQSWFTQFGKDVAHEQGWYKRRHVVQRWFIGGLIASAVAGFLAALWLLRRSWRSTWLVMGGTAFLLAFIVIRAASIHHVDRLLKSSVAGAKLNWVFELGGIAIICAGAALNLRQYKKGPPSEETAGPRDC